MARSPSQQRSTSHAGQTHDYGALEQRVYGTERAIADLSTQTSRQIEGVRTELSAAVERISSKIDAQQTQALTTGRTDWKAFFGTGASVLVAVGGIFFAIINPMISDISKISDKLEKFQDGYVKIELLREDERKQDKRDDVVQDRLDRLGDNKLSKEVHAAYEKAVTQRFEDTIKMYDARISELEKTQSDRLNWAATTIASIQGNLVTRSENQAHWEEQTAALASAVDAQNQRSSAIVSSLNEIRREFTDAFNSGDAMKDMAAQLRSIWTRLGTPKHAGDPE